MHNAERGISHESVYKSIESMCASVCVPVCANVCDCVCLCLSVCAFVRHKQQIVKAIKRANRLRESTSWMHFIGNQTAWFMQNIASPFSPLNTRSPSLCIACPIPVYFVGYLNPLIDLLSQHVTRLPPRLPLPKRPFRFICESVFVRVCVFVCSTCVCALNFHTATALRHFSSSQMFLMLRGGCACYTLQIRVLLGICYI